MDATLERSAERVSGLERLARLRERGTYFGGENTRVVGLSAAPTAPRSRISSSDVGPGVASLGGSVGTREGARWGRRALPLLIWAIVAAVACLWIGRAQQSAPQPTVPSAAEDSDRAGDDPLVMWRAPGGASARTRTESKSLDQALARSWAPFSEAADIRRLIREEWSASAECQAERTASICQLDQKLSLELFARGWCWGQPGQPEHVKEWNPCPRGATAPGRESVEIYRAIGRARLA